MFSGSLKGYLKTTHPLSSIQPETMPILPLLNRSPDSLLAEGWTASQFSAATLSLAARLRAHKVQAAALWFDDAARFASALLAAWLAGAEVY
ncbi:MAG: AMP-binding enzyme family protein, partial [Kingella oralis]